MWVGPLLVSIVYIFGLPWLNLWIDDLLSYSNEKQSKRVHKKELNAIYLKTEIAIANIDLEMRQSEYRELKKHNETIEALNDSIKKLEEDFSIEREVFRNDIAGLNEVNDKLTKTIKDYYTQFTQLKYLFDSVQHRLKAFKLKEEIELISMNNIEGDIKKILKLLNETERYADIIDANRIGREIDKTAILEDAIKEGLSHPMDNVIRTLNEHD